jgi:hypothetical protein
LANKKEISMDLESGVWNKFEIFTVGVVTKMFLGKKLKPKWISAFGFEKGKNHKKLK